MDPKVLFIMIDGLGDSSNEIFEGKTYLQQANIPSLNSLANCGLTGLMDPVETGLACGSDTAHMSIFGYPPYNLYQGRGSFETMGSGLELDYEEIAFKCNFATIDPSTGIVTKRRVSRRFYEWGLDMIESINNIQISGFENYKISVKHATEHRCGLKISGAGLSNEIEGTDPLRDNLPLLTPYATNPSNENAVKTALIVKAASDMIYNILSRHPINLERIKSNKKPGNILLLRGAGIKLKVKPFDEIHGTRSFFIAPTAIIRGWGMTIGSQIIDVPGTTGDVHSNFENKFNALKPLFEQGYNFGFLHIKAIDDLGHDRNTAERLRLIEKIDGLIGKYIELLKSTVIVVTGDHSTNAHIGDHSHEPVPFVIALSDNYKKINGNLCFNEVDCARGALGRFPGSEVMKLIFAFKSEVYQN